MRCLIGFKTHTYSHPPAEYERSTISSDGVAILMSHIHRKKMTMQAFAGVFANHRLP